MGYLRHCAVLRGTAIWPSLFASIRVALALLSAPSLLTSTAFASEPFRIAFALPESGSLQAIGRDVKTAAALALRDYQVKLGAKPANITLSFYDDKCTSEGGALLARQLTDASTAQASVIVGHFCPSASDAAAPIYSAAGLPFMAAGSLPTGSVSTHHYGPYHFRLPGERSQGALIASRLLNATEPRIAFVRDRTQYAIDAIHSVAIALGIKIRDVVLQEAFTGGDKEFTALAQRIKASAVSHVVLSAFPSEAGLLIADVRKLNPDVEILATDQLVDPSFARSFSTAAEGVLVPVPADFSKLSAAKDIARRISASDATASRVALATYAAMECIFAAVQGDQPKSAAEFSKALTTQQFDTILGPVRFDGMGDASISRYALFTWTGARLVPAAASLDQGVATGMRLP